MHLLSSIFVPVKQKTLMKKIKLDTIFNEFTLMGMAVLGAFYLKEYWEGIAVISFYFIGEWFQHKAVRKAKNNIKALLDIRPETTTLIKDGQEMTVSPQAISTGSIIEIKVGERIPLDGILLNKNASFNTAALTGESLPRNIRQNGEVLAGMISMDQVIRIQVTKAYDESALSRILKMIQEAAERKAPTELFIRKFARIYTPIVTALAILMLLLPLTYSLLQPSFIFVFNEWFYRALVFLVVSCPCALVVSIPLGYFGGIGAASHNGILFKGGNYLDAITKINTVVFDKTGTLTKGIFGIQAIKTVSGISETKLLQLIASTEKYSNHPIANAIVQVAKDKGIFFITPLEVTEIAGHGLKAQIDGQEIHIGNARLFTEHHIAYPQNIDFRNENIVLCAINNKYKGHISLADTPKEGLKHTIMALKALNINNIQILSGDKQSIVSNLAKQIGISQAYGDLLPEGKVKHMNQLKANPENHIAFVGDGINDAPVLALSDVGIAMGDLGSDAAIETADVVIQDGQLSKIATAIRIGKLTQRIVWQNISLVLGVKLLVLILGTGGMATLWEAVFADVGVALLSICNAIKIQKRMK